MSEPKEPSRAQQLVGDFAPKLAELTDDVLFGDVWERAELAPRDRSLVTVAALIANGSTSSHRSGWPGCRAEQGAEGDSTTWGLYRRRVEQCCPHFEMVSRSHAWAGDDRAAAHARPVDRALVSALMLDAS